ncbi:MAG: hypothetical protein ACJAS3_003127 [Roseivirga sp.]|jgi:hypothetical protein
MRNLSPLFILLFVFACSDQKIDTKKAREGLKSQEIQVVSDANILEKATEMGNQYLALKSIDFTPEGLYKIELQDSIRFLPSEIFLPYGIEVALSGKAKDVFDAYNYNYENGIKSSSNVQFGADKKFIIYTLPVNYEDKEVGIFLIQILRKEIVLSFAD